MGELNEGFSAIDFLSMRSSNRLMLCKDLRELEPNHNPDDNSFKITSFLSNPKTWYDCASNVLLSEFVKENK